jgi:branched-chain amino acid transport system ATP-binding protein
MPDRPKRPHAANGHPANAAALSLAIESLTTGYGRVAVLHDIELHVAPGEMVTVVGANGAGKSTLLKTVAGLVPVRRGTITFEGRDITRLKAERRVNLGMALVPEGRRLFGPLTVAENLELGAYSRRRTGSDALAGAREDVYRLFPRLSERSSQAAATLSGGEQQMLAIGRALMSSPRLLLLDEPSLGLAPLVVKEIFAALDELRRTGVTVLLVEQDARLALKHADRGYVLRTGRVALSGTAEDLVADDDVRLIYLGQWHGKGSTR